MQGWRISAGALVEHQGRVLLVHHLRPGRYDFWVAPGGGVKADESYEQAARREVHEETALQVQVGALRYIEDLVSPECRYVKFWFSAELLGGRLDSSHPEARAEHVVEAAWLGRDDFAGRHVFPPVLLGRYWADRTSAGWADGSWSALRLPLREMVFW
jgi:8-oxo-dGTP diphosphatase